MFFQYPPACNKTRSTTGCLENEAASKIVLMPRMYYCLPAKKAYSCVKACFDQNGLESTRREKESEEMPKWNVYWGKIRDKAW